MFIRVPNAPSAALLVQFFFVSRIARFRRDIIGKIMATLITMVCFDESPHSGTSKLRKVSILAFAGFLAIMVLVSVPNSASYIAANPFPVCEVRPKHVGA